MQLDTSERASESSKLAAEVISNFPEFTSLLESYLTAKQEQLLLTWRWSTRASRQKGRNTWSKRPIKGVLCFYSRHETYINKICLSIKEYPEKEVQGEIHRLSQSLKASRSSLKNKGDKFGTLLELVCAQWSYLTAENEGSTDLKRTNVEKAHGTQILGFLSLLHMTRILETLWSSYSDRNRRGQECGTWLTSVLLALLGFSVDVVS